MGQIGCGDGYEDPSELSIHDALVHLREQAVRHEDSVLLIYDREGTPMATKCCSSGIWTPTHLFLLS